MHGEVNLEQFKEPYRIPEGLWSKVRNLLLILAVLGWAPTIYGWMSDPYNFYGSYLVNYMFWLSIAWGATFFVAIQHLASAGWSVTVRRLMENIMIALPLMIILFIPVAIGVPTLYEWAQDGFFESLHTPGMEFKAIFFSPTFYIIRTVIYFAVWFILAFNLYRNSVAQDGAGNPEARGRLRWWSAPGLLVLMATVTMAAVDWMMSLDPHWYSTIFGVYVLSGGVLAFIALLILISLGLRKAGVLTKSIHREHYHDLGKWMFAFTMWWAYIAFSQYLLIWYADIPEETVFFHHRMEGSWVYLSALLLVGHFIIPFLVLISRAAKRNYIVLALAACWILLMHGMDLHWLILPSVHPHNFHIQWLDVTTFWAVGSVFLLGFWYKLRSTDMIPTGDVRLTEALTHHNV
jgi:hypothetical protein